MVNIKLQIPEKVSTNKIYAGMHWTARNKLKDLYQMTMMQFKNKTQELDYPIDSTYIFTFKGKMLDVSNCTYMVKLLEDGLKVNKIIPDDDAKHVQSITIVTQEGPEDTVEIILC